MSETTEKFEAWAVVELMGHQRLAGQVSEQLVAGTPMLRVDVPATEGEAKFSKLFSPSAIYGISPASEEVVRLAAAQIRARPINVWIPEIDRVPALPSGEDEVEF